MSQADPRARPRGPAPLRRPSGTPPTSRCRCCARRSTRSRASTPPRRRAIIRAGRGDRHRIPLDPAPAHHLHDGGPAHHLDRAGDRLDRQGDRAHRRSRQEHRRGRDLHRQGHRRAPHRRSRWSSARRSADAIRLERNSNRTAMGGAILVVEDEPAIQELIAVNLEHAGHQVLRAGNVPEAEALVREVLPDLVLLDWMLPGPPGPELRAAAAHRPAHQGHPDHHAHRARAGAGQDRGPRRRRRRLRHQAVLAARSCWRASRR